MSKHLNKSFNIIDLLTVLTELKLENIFKIEEKFKFFVNQYCPGPGVCLGGSDTVYQYISVLSHLCIRTDFLHTLSELLNRERPKNLRCYTKRPVTIER